MSFPSACELCEVNPCNRIGLVEMGFERLRRQIINANNDGFYQIYVYGLTNDQMAYFTTRGYKITINTKPWGDSTTTISWGHQKSINSENREN